MTSTISLMMNGMQQFADANGVPYLGGKVHMYVPPATTTPKTTWQDMDRIAENTDPIILDSAGRCVIWGEGIYRQILLDMNDNVVWDKLTLSFTTADDVLSILADALVTYYDIAYSQTISAGGDDLLRYEVVRAIRLPAGLTGTQVSCKANPTATWTFTLYQNLVSIGTIAISTSSVVTITFTADVDFVPGDVFRVGAGVSTDVGTMYLSATFVTTVL